MSDELRRRKIVRTCDILMGLVFALYILTRMSTLFLFNVTATETGADIEAVHTAYEANPVTKLLMTLKMQGYILQFLFVPAIGFTVYFIFRRKVLYGGYNPDVLQFHTIFLFFFTLLNFVNDFISLVGRLL